MPRIHRSPRWSGLAAVTLVALCACSALQGQQPKQKRESIGEVLGRPVHRDEIETDGDVDLRDVLHSVFAVPVLKKYRASHAAEIKPTEAELAAAAAYFDAQHRKRMEQEEPKLRERLKTIEQKLRQPGLEAYERQDLEIERQAIPSRLSPPGRDFAKFMLDNWKFQKHLYDTYGGGRILWQQAGIEAFDAYRSWLEDCEKRGQFKITDPELRKVFYEYWTTMDHGGFLMDNEERIREYLLEPEWMAKPDPAE